MFYELEKVENCRDLGGIVTKEGYRIKNNVLFRAGLLSSATENDKEALRNMGIKAIVDFRSLEEVGEKPDIVIEGVDNYNLLVNEEDMPGVSRKEKDKDHFVERVVKASMQNTNYFKEFMVECYRKLIRSEYSSGIYRQFLDLLLEEKYDKILWHCTAGKDRTGVAAIFVLEILNVDRNVIYENYVETNKHLGNSTDELVKYLHVLIPDQKLADEIAKGFVAGLRAEKEFFDAAYDEMEKISGSVDSYLLQRLGVDEQFKMKLRNKFLEK